jgi:hypothetical protein
MSAFGGKADMAISERDDSARMFPKLDLRADIHQAMRCARRFIAGEGTLENP